MRFSTALLATTIQLTAQVNGFVQLLPAGEFAARDGRPGNGRKWRLDDSAGADLAARVNRVAATNPLVIDYEHQTLHAMSNGQPAPAAGWIQRVEWRPGQGLYGQVEWTERALTAIKAGEYRYISPVILFDDTGAVTGLEMAAVTNYPALLGMDAVVAALNALNPRSQEPDMALLAALVAALGLPATTTEAELQAAVTALKAKADAAPAKAAIPAALVAELGLNAADEQAALSAIKALKQADQSTNGLVVQLTQQVAALTAQLQGGELERLVDGAIQAGKFTPAHKDWLTAQGKRDLAALRSLIDTSPVIPGLAGQSKQNGEQAHGQGGGAAALTATQKLVAKQLGIPEADYLKQLQAEAATA